jgi:hypothetical protein
MYIVHIATCMLCACVYRISLVGSWLWGLHACMSACMRSSPYHQRKCQKATGMIIPHSLCSLHSAPPFTPAPRHRRSTHTGSDVAPMHATVEWTSTSPCCTCLPYAFFFFEKALCLSIQRSLSRGSTRSTHGSLFYSLFFPSQKSFWTLCQCIACLWGFEYYMLTDSADVSFLIDRSFSFFM